METQAVVASVPFFASIDQSACGTSSTSSSARSTITGEGPSSRSPVSSCARTAASTTGSLRPRTTGPQPHMKSRYSLPSASHTRLPSPRVMNCG